jgi:hypothetical protein
MNFVRSKCDERAMQSLMQRGRISLRVRNELLGQQRCKRADADLNSTIAPDAMSCSFGAARMTDSQGTAVVRFVRRRAIGLTEDPTLLNED